MPGIRAKEYEHPDAVLRKFKKQCERSNVLKDIRRHEFYLKPGVRKRMKSALARKRADKLLMREK